LRKNVRTDLHEIFREGLQWPVNKRLNFGGGSAARLDTGIVFWIRHYGKLLTDINLLPIVIRQMAAMVRRALAEIMLCPSASS